MIFTRLQETDLLSSRKRGASSGGVPTRFLEHRHFVKLAAQLVDFGFMVSWLPVDDSGADFIAIHIKTSEVIKVQLKSRITTDEKYFGKNLYMAFPRSDKALLKDWVIVPHDLLCEHFPYAQNKAKSNYQSTVKSSLWPLIQDLSVVGVLDI